jgi:hypothetical protein
VGVTFTEPLSGRADVLTDGEMLTAVALEVCHCKETCCPAVIVVTVADSVAVGAGSEFELLEAFELPQDDRPETVRMRHNRDTGRRMFEGDANTAIQTSFAIVGFSFSAVSCSSSQSRSAHRGCPSKRFGNLGAAIHDISPA